MLKEQDQLSCYQILDLGPNSFQLTNEIWKRYINGICAIDN